MNAQVIPFPVPPPAPARAVLQPSIHARGARPYTFAGTVDEFHAPGCAYRNGNTLVAVDAAWLVAPVLGAPKSQPARWPGVPEARANVEWYAASYVTPDGKQLRHYQVDGASFLAERDYAILSDAPGVGKTSQALVAAEARLALGVVPSATTPVVLILCPALAKRHWQREVKRWTGHDAVVLDGLRPDAEKLTTRYVICNYDILYGQRRRDPAGVMHAREDLPGWGKLLANRFLIVIADELHLLRGTKSQKTAAVNAVALRTPVVWGLTGTLIPNYIRDIYAQVNFISGGLFGKYWPWAQKYCDAHQAQYGWVDNGASNLDELKQRLSLFVLGRTPASVQLELPPLQRERYAVDVEVTAPTVHEGARTLDRGKMVSNALRATARAKRSAVVQHAVDALSAKQKVVVFVYMREQCDAVAKDIAHKVDCQMLVVHGDMSPEGRDKMATTFREADAPACFVATIDSVGLAISLVGANLVIFGDLLPEPWKMYQAELRCHRFDSLNPVLVRYLLATGTIDETYAETVIDKIETIQATMGEHTDQAAIGTLMGGKSTEEIVDTLFAKLIAHGGGDGEG